MSEINKIKKSRKKALSYLGMNDSDFNKVSKKTSGKILGIDYGTKNVGLSISDGSQSQAFVYDTIKMDRGLFSELKKICESELIDKIVVGLPLSMNGEYSDKTNEVVFFVEELEARTGKIVETEDERLSSKEADKMENNHGRDEESARIILQQYLDRNNNL